MWRLGWHQHHSYASRSVMQAMDDLPLEAQLALVSRTFHGTDPFPVSQRDLYALYQSGNAHFSAADGSTVWVSIRQRSITVLTYGVQNASINIALFAALDVDKIGNLSPGSIMNTKNIFPCLMSTAHMPPCH